MAERRSLIEGMKNTPPPIERQRENEFVYGQEMMAGKPSDPVAPAAVPTVLNHSRSPLSTRIRSDFAAALKRASLERQLNKIEPNTLQDILEEAIEPWLRSNNYLP
jgi:hypothetical protein